MGSAVGTVVAFAGSSVPSGWLECDGASYTVASRPTLHAVLGDAFGGDGGTNFNVPDLQGRAILGVGAGAGLTSRALADQGGQEAITDIPAHTHSVAPECQSGAPNETNPADAYPANSAAVGNLYNTAANDTMAATTSGSTGDASVNVMNPFTVLKYIIKAELG